MLAACEARGWTLGVAESLTGGLIGARLANVPGASRTFQGSLATYATDVKRSVLGVTAEHVVSEECAKQMAEGAQRVLGADVAISATGVAGPDEQDGQPVGTVWLAIAIPGHETEAVSMRMPGDRERIRQFSTISLLNLLADAPRGVAVARGARVRRGAPAGRGVGGGGGRGVAAVRGAVPGARGGPATSSGTSRCSSSATTSDLDAVAGALGALVGAGG